MGMDSKPENTIPTMKNMGGSVMLWAALAVGGSGALEKNR